MATLLAAAVALRLSRPLFALIAGVTDAEAEAASVAEPVEHDRPPAWRRILMQLATRAGLLSAGAVLASLYPAVTVVLARSIGKEHITRRQFAGLALALALALAAVAL